MGRDRWKYCPYCGGAVCKTGIAHTPDCPATYSSHHAITRPESDVLEMAELRTQGQTLQQIGDRYGITRERVRQLLAQRLGMRGHRRTACEICGHTLSGGKRCQKHAQMDMCACGNLKAKPAKRCQKCASTSLARVDRQATAILYGRGYTHSQLAELFGVGAMTIHKVIADAGYAGRRRGAKARWQRRLPPIEEAYRALTEVT